MPIVTNCGRERRVVTSLFFPPICGRKFFELYAASPPQALPRPLNPFNEAGIIFQLIVEPVLLRRETDENTCWLAMPRDDEPILLRDAQVLRQVILDL